jgi:hypothetical protein
MNTILIVVIIAIAVFLFIACNNKNTNNSENFTRINDKLIRFSRNEILKGSGNEASSYSITAIGNDGDTVKIVGTLPAIVNGQEERPPGLLYMGPTGDALFRTVELGKEYKCLPVTFGGIDPAPNVKKSCFVAPM